MNEETRIGSEAIDLMDSLWWQLREKIWDKAEEIAATRGEPVRIVESDVEQAFKNLTKL